MPNGFVFTLSPLTIVTPAAPKTGNAGLAASTSGANDSWLISGLAMVTVAVVATAHTMSRKAAHQR